MITGQTEENETKKEKEGKKDMGSWDWSKSPYSFFFAVYFKPELKG